MAAVTTAVVGAAGVANSIYQGNKANSAAKKATRAQVEASQQAQQSTDQRFNMLRRDLSPYRQAGAAALPLLTDFATNPQAQFDFLQSNPIFQASLRSADRDTVGAAARVGRLGTGDFSAQLQDNYLLSATPLLQQREQQLLNLASIGGNASAQTGQAGLQAAGMSNEYGLQGANAVSAGLAAQNQIRQNTANQVLGGIGTLAPIVGGLMAPPPGTISNDYTGAAMQNWIAGRTP